MDATAWLNPAPASGSELSLHMAESLFLLVQLCFLAEVVAAQLGDLIPQLLDLLVG
jgi:hypothetical protein